MWYSKTHAVSCFLIGMKIADPEKNFSKNLSNRGALYLPYYAFPTVSRLTVDFA